MIGRSFKFHDGEKGAALAIRVKTGSRKDRFKRILKDGTVVVQLKGVGGDINTALIKFLAKELDIPAEQIEIIADKEDKNKLVSIINTPPKAIQQAILDRIG